MGEKFAINFGASLLGHFIINVIVWILVGLTFRVGVTIPIWLWLIILYAPIIILHFFLGIKLNLLGKHWLNYLSVSGSFISAFLMVGILFNPLLMAFLIPMERTAQDMVIYFILAAVPSIFTWLGMLSKFMFLKIRRKRSSND